MSNKQNDPIEAKAQRFADETAFLSVLEKAKEFYQSLTGEEPDETSDIWAWFITNTYDTALRTYLTKGKGKVS